MDTKKKKNKKKKGNQNKSAEDAASTANAEEISIQANGNGSELEDNNHTNSMQDLGSSSTSVHNHSANNSIKSDEKCVGVSESDVNQEGHKSDEANCMYLEEEVRKLKDEGNIWQQKQAGLEDKVESLVTELNMYAQKGFILEEKLNNIQNENDSLIRRQALLEDKVSIIGGIKESVNTKEVSMKEMISKVQESNMALQVQVKELEGSQNSNLEGKQQLLEKITLLESKIEFVEKDMFSRSENLIQKLTKLYAENSTLHISGENAVVNKLANESAAETSRKSEKPYSGTRDNTIAESSALDPNHIEIPDETSRPSSHTSHPDDITFNINKMVITDECTKNTTDEFVSETTLSKPFSNNDSQMSEEIVPVPVDEIEIQEDEPQKILVDETSDVSFSDAPLIGAPFRLISFVTRYVSGADLVDRSDPKSGR